MNKRNQLLAVIGAIVIVLLIALGIYFTMQKEEDKEEEKPNYQQEVATIIQNMKGLQNYTVTQTRETVLAYPTHSYDSSNEVIFQVDMKNHKVFNVQGLQYYDFTNQQMYSLLGDLNSLLEPIDLQETYLKEESFQFNFEIPYNTEKVGDNYKLILTQENFIAFMKQLGHTVYLDNATFNDSEVIVRIDKQNIKTIEVSYEVAGEGYDGPYTRKEKLKFEYTNLNNTILPNEPQEIYDAVKELLGSQETDSFVKTLDNVDHTIDVTYHYEIYGSSIIAIAEMRFDNQRIRNYQYMMYLESATNLESLKNYKVQDLTRQFSQNNFYTIQGEKEQFLAIYSNYFSEIGNFSDLTVVNGKGQSVIKLEDKINMGIEPLMDFKPHGYTKVNKDSVHFYAYCQKDQTGTEEGITIHEYKLTFGDTLQFESIKTYPGIKPSGDGQYFNDIVQE